MIDPIDLPSGFYVRRQVVSDQLAACLLLKPGYCPTREEMPREEIACDNLRRVMAFTTMSAGNSLRMACLIKRELGVKYLFRLVNMCHPATRGNFIQIGFYRLYFAQLRELHRVSREHEAALKALHELQKRCRNLKEF